jgi:FlaA1/EpsC-like NDP-sugar epimerase
LSTHISVNTDRRALLVDLPRTAKQLLAMLTDTALCVLTVWLAICFRFESWVILSDFQWLAVGISVALGIPLLVTFGFYHTVIRYAGKQTVTAALRAIGLYTIIYSAIFTVYSFPLVPRAIGILQPLLLLVGLALVRIIASQLLGEQIANSKAYQQLPGVLIYGAGNSGQQLAGSIRASGQSRVVGFLDDNSSLHKAQIAGIPVYPASAVHQLTRQHNVSDVLLAIPRITRTRRNEIIRNLSQSKVAIRTLPSLSDLASGKIAESDLRELDIEDLLGRDPVTPIRELLTKNIAGKVVLVTGAGGSIGSELCRQISKLAPQHLILLELSEFALYSINEELSPVAERENFLLTPVLANVQDRIHIEHIISHYQPQTIYHAAAYKHVPLVESNPLAGMRNNVLGTLNIAQAALAHKVMDMVLISTDKAVRPTNIMGASKRIAEIYIQNLALSFKDQTTSTRFSIVRFGNVLGSSGSVIPKFREQIRSGGPVTITDPNVTRYFMTVIEAAQLVIQAAAIQSSHEQGANLYLLDMGESVNITSLARSMIQLTGHQEKTTQKPDGDIEILFTGLRPGEKLYEELLIEGNPVKTQHPKIFTAKEMMLNNASVTQKCEALLSQQNQLSRSDIVTVLTEMNIGYALPNMQSVGTQVSNL